MLKALLEKRNTLIGELEGLVSTIETEKRAFTADENTRIETVKAEISNIDATISTMEDVKKIEKKEVRANEDKKPVEKTQDQVDNEELRAIFEKRAAMNTAVSAEGGYFVNDILSSEIIDILKDRSSVFSFFDGTSVPGNLKIPKKTSSGTAAWKAEGTSPDSTAAATIPNLDIIVLGQNRLYRESALTQSMLNVQELDLKSFVITDIGETMGDSIETAIFNGSGTDEPTGLISGIKEANKVTLDTRGAITIDSLKKCRNKLKKTARKGAKWFMNSETLLEIDLLKDADGRPLLQPDLTKESDYTLLGYPVDVTDALVDLAETGANTVIVFASAKAYHTNIQKKISINIYDDSSYKRAGLVGYAADVYMDGNVKDDQRVASIVNPA